MKKILTSLIIIALNFLIINQSSAENLENKLYKQVSITSKQVEKDYWKKVNAKIVSQFVMYRYTKNITFLNKLEIALKSWIRSLNSKDILSRNEKKKLNFYNNLYYRSKLLLDYNLK